MQGPSGRENSKEGPTPGMPGMPALAFPSAMPMGAMGAAAAGAKDAAGAALSGAKDGLKSMIPNPQAIADQITGGLASGISLDKVISTFMVGSIDRQANKNLRRLIGGAYLELALANIDTRAGKTYTETVGGAKLTIAAKGKIGQTVDGANAVTVGGLLMRKAKKNISYSSKNSSVRVGAGLSLKSDELIELKSKKIVLEAASEVTFSVAGGALLLTLKPTGVEMKGKVALNGADKITVLGAKDLLT
jgi:hypothetical protein